MVELFYTKSSTFQRLSSTHELKLSVFVMDIICLKTVKYKKNELNVLLGHLKVCPTLNMLVLGALCALLLPLAASLDNCDMTKAANCLAGRHLQGDLLKYVSKA